MQYLRIKKGTTSKIVQIYAFDSSSATGAGLTGLVYNTAGLTAYYNREGAAGAATQITLVSATKGTYVSGGFAAVDSTNMPAFYELHIPDAALAAGAGSVVVTLRGATNLVPVKIFIELLDNVEADNYALLADSNFGLDKLVRSTTPANTLDVLTGKVDIGDKTGFSLSADQSGVTIGLVNGLATSAVAEIWNKLLTEITTAGSIGKLVKDYLDTTISSRLASVEYTAPDNTSVAAIKSKTDNLPSGIKKNSSLANFEFFMADSANGRSAKTGLTVTATRSIDGTAFAACANSVTEVGNGIYKIDLAAADLNGDVITLRFEAAGADSALITLVTES